MRSGYERLTVDVDLVIGLKPDNIARGLRALEAIDYHMALPVSAEDFSDSSRREKWRTEKGMVVLKFWSDLHRRTPLDVFIYEPFDFEPEYDRAVWQPISGEMPAPILAYEALLEMKRTAGRTKDLLDLEALRKLAPYR